MTTERRPKYLTISRLIEDQIRRGLWQDGMLLSSRGIAEEHQVSPVTASRALQVLRDKGLIRTFDRLGSYLAPTAPVEGSTARWALCFRVTPGPWHQATLSTTRAGFQQMARRHGMELDTESLAEGAVGGPVELRRRVNRAVAAGVSGLFFLPSRVSGASASEDEAILSLFRDAGLPVVLVERNLRGPNRPLEYDLVAMDDVDGGFRCTRHLLDQGRRRVAFVTGSPTSSHEGRLAGYLAALNAIGDQERNTPRPLVLEQDTEIPLKAAYQRLADRILADRVDGVVCFQDYTAIGLILELLTRGARIPREIGLTGFDDLPIGDSFALGVTTFAPPAEAIAEEALRLMRRRIEEPSAPALKVLVPGRLIIRESSGPHRRALGDGSNSGR